MSSGGRFESGLQDTLQPRSKAAEWGGGRISIRNTQTFGIAGDGFLDVPGRTGIRFPRA